MIDEFLKRFGDYAAHQGETWRLKNPELMDAYQAACEHFNRQYAIGDLTSKQVFQKNGIHNIYDLQAVFNAVEAALQRKLLDPKGIYNLGVEEAAQQVDAVWRRRRGVMNCTELCAEVRSLLNTGDDVPEFVKVVPVPAAIKGQALEDDLLAELMPMATEPEKFAPKDKATQDQMAAVMLAHGNDGQVSEAVAHFRGVSSPEHNWQAEVLKLRAEIGQMSKLLHGMPPQNGSLVARLEALVERAAQLEMESRASKLNVSKWMYEIGDRVRKKSGSWWEGKVVGFYSTMQTPRGYAVQLQTRDDNGPVQIYPESALELRP